jgi:periplasmic protein TonB
MLRKLICIALFAASFTACLDDKKPKASAADALSSESLPPSITDTTTAAEAEATRAVSDKEALAAKQPTKEEKEMAAKKAAARKKAVENAMKKEKAEAKKADKPKAVPAPAKPKMPAPKTDKKVGQTAKDAGVSLPATTDKVKKRSGKDDVFVRSEIAPAYIGGDKAMIKYLQNNLRYPVIAKENGVKGTVFVQFVVEKDGKVSDITVLKGVDASLNAEAKRVVSAMPKWTAGQQNGQAVAVQYVLPVKFDLVE